MIAILAEGAMRDALSILERCVQDGDNKIDENKIRDLVGIPSMSLVHGIIDSIFSYNVEEALTITDKVLDEGKDIVNFLWEMIKYCKDVLVCKTSGKVEMYNEEEKKQIRELAKKVEKEKIINIIYEMSEMENEIKRTTQKTIMFQAGIIKLCCNRNEVSNDIKESGSNSTNIGLSSNLEERVAKIENYLRNNRNAGTQTSAVNNSYRVVQTNNTDTVAKKENIKNETKVNNSESTKTTANFSKNSAEYWPQILSDLKQRGKRVLYTNLMGTNAKELNDMTVGIEFPRGMTPFGKLVLDKQENIKEITDLVSIACGKQMNIKYIVPDQNNQVATREENLQNLAKESDIPFQIIE